MPSSGSTRWTIIRGAAQGKPLDRAEFARRYASIIRSYLGARWRNGPLAAELEDVVQEVFVTCFKEDGPLSRADPERPGGFRAYLYGVVRNVLRADLEAGVDPKMLQHWKRDPDLAGVRDGDDLTEGWRKLWADVDAQLAQASAPR